MKFEKTVRFSHFCINAQFRGRLFGFLCVCCHPKTFFPHNKSRVSGNHAFFVIAILCHTWYNKTAHSILIKITGEKNAMF